jgi:aldose 1-epimerase
MPLKKFEIVKLGNGPFSCEILANYGAALNSYRFQNIEFVDGYLNPEETVNQQYKGVVLAPFPNRIAAAKYTFNNQSYILDINRAKEGLALHGFLYNHIFKVVELQQNRCTLLFRYTELKNGFPFPFKLKVSYNLDAEGRLKVSFQIENIGTEAFPFGLGWHPYFNFKESIDDLKLDFPASQRLILDDKKIPTGQLHAFTKESDSLNLVDHEFDDCFKLLDSGMQVFKLCGSKYELEISAEQSNFPYFQVYTPKNRKSIAIEPMTCAPDAFNNGLGLQILKAGEVFEATYYLKATRV